MHVLPPLCPNGVLSPRKRWYTFQSFSDKLPVKVPASFSNALGRGGEPIVSDS